MSYTNLKAFKNLPFISGVLLAEHGGGRSMSEFFSINHPFAVKKSTFC